MLPSPVHLKLYFEITDLEWDSFDFQADGEKTTHRGFALKKKSFLRQRNYTLFTANFKNFYFFLPEHFKTVTLRLQLLKKSTV